MGAVRGREAARHDDGTGRDAAVGYLAGLAIVDPRARADEDAHREDRAALDDHAFDDLGARADEAAVLDDRRARLQRLEHPADPRAAGEVHVAADLRAGA